MIRVKDFNNNAEQYIKDIQCLCSGGHVANAYINHHYYTTIAVITCIKTWQ